MKVYISGISGAGMGPLALMAKQAGFEVCGSDLGAGAVVAELEQAGIPFKIGPQDGAYLTEMKPDWFVHTSALPKDHAEIKEAQRLGIRVSKRDELIAHLIEKLGLKMVAIAGTHGKTTTTSMIIWACKHLNIPVSYLVGAVLSFGAAGQYDPTSKFLIYEADEYDRNFLHYYPWYAVIPTISYDHPDIYPTPASYTDAFDQFQKQCRCVVAAPPSTAGFTLTGPVRRSDAAFACAAVEAMVGELGLPIAHAQVVETLNLFPGAGRRFECLREGVFTDYGHHPEEVAATVAIAAEECAKEGRRGVVVVYQPHQNTRQHAVLHQYTHVFEGVTHLYWLPTHLAREDPSLPLLHPKDFFKELSKPVQDVAEEADLNADLEKKIQEWIENRYLLLLISAGKADSWFRNVIKQLK